jgi:GNAT superfamily N-acetyltransferase
MSYRVIRYHPKYDDEIASLQTGLWSRDLATNSAYFSWKYEQNPYLSEPLIYLALENDRVIGMRGFYGVQWDIGGTGQTVSLPCAGDTIIAPEHRRRGLLRQMVQFETTDSALAAFPFALSFSASPSVYFCLLSEGWRSIGAYNALERPAPFKRLFNSKRLKNWVNRHKATINRLRRAAAQLRRSSASRRQIQTSSEPRAEQMAMLVALTAQPDKMRPHKDSRFYAWRFRSPLSRYQFFYSQESALDGFLVVRRPAKGSKTGPVQLVDWAATGPEILTDLVEAALRDASLNGLQVWSVTLPDPTVAALSERGFTPVEGPLSDSAYRPSLLVRPRLDASPGGGQWSFAGFDLADLKNWELRMACSDQY